MRKAEIPVRCYAEREPDGSWFAMCVDLNLYARADSFESVRKELDEIVAEYVREALTEDREYAEQLLSRRAPIGFWLKYYFIKVMCRIVGNRADGDKPRSFKERLPLAPAW